MELPAAEDVTIQDKEVIEAARAAYDALTDSQKSKIDEGLFKYFTDAEDALQAAIESEKNGHSWFDAIVTKEPTCTETGIVKYTCKTCGITKEEEIATLDHTWDEGIVTKPPTCMESGNKKYVCSICNATKNEIIPMSDHSWDTGVVTKEATDKSDGIRTYTCKVCGHKKNERIPTIEIIPGETTTDEMDTVLTNREDDSDPEGSKFSVLCLKIKKVAKTSHVLTWKEDSHADSYLIYASKCGKKNKLKFITETTGKTYTHKKLKKGTYYKYIVVAATSDGIVTSVSKMLHSATTGGKVGNAKAVKTAAKKSKVTVKKGKSFRLKAKTVKASSKLTIKVHRGMKYESTNTKIATISAKGVIKGKAKGKCYVYAYAQNGKYAKITVTVK